jgi:hypothetical protein
MAGHEVGKGMITFSHSRAFLFAVPLLEEQIIIDHPTPFPT